MHGEAVCFCLCKIMLPALKHVSRAHLEPISCAVGHALRAAQAVMIQFTPCDEIAIVSD